MVLLFRHLYRGDYIKNEKGILLDRVCVCVCAYHLGLALVVEGEDIVSAAGLTLPHQEDSVALQARVLDQVGRLDPRDGAVEPGVQTQEVVRLMVHLLREGKGRRA